MDTWGHTGDEMGIGGCEKGERETACRTATGDPQRPRGTVYLPELLKSHRRDGAQLFGESLPMGQCLHRKLPFPDKEGMAEPVLHHGLRLCVQACI